MDAATISTLPLRLWYDTKIAFERSANVTTDALHIFAGVGIFFAAALLFRWPLSRWRPWLVLLALTLFNELVDLWSERWPVRAMQYGEGIKDLVLTLAVPSFILVTARLAPWLYGNRARRGSAASRRRRRRSAGRIPTA